MQDWIEEERTGTDWIGMGRTGQDWIEEERTGTDWNGLGRTGQDWTEVDRTGTDWNGLGRTGTDWNGLGRTGTDWGGLDPTRPGCAGQIFSKNMAPAATFCVAETGLLAWCLGPKVRPVNPYFLLGVHAAPGGLAVRISGLKSL